MDNSLFGQEADAKSTHLVAMKNHEKLWAEKSRIRWLKEGDPNSKFFHLYAKIKRVKNTIRRVKKSDSSMISDRDEIACYISSFYEDFHKGTPVTDHLDLLDAIPKLIDEVNLLSLDSILGPNEIKRAVWDLDPVVCQVQMAILGISSGAVGILYLEISKELIISEEQGPFQKGKLIHNNIALASELANIMHSSTRGGRLGAKIDIQKAFGRISWDFILKVLKKFGFSNTWLKWIFQILSTSKISILLNGGPVGFFGVERGLRQGDPISPILFIIAEEVFCRGLKHLLHVKEIKPLKGPRDVSVPTHLLFANDIFIFINASSNYVKNLKNFIRKYQEFSGQVMNLEKSKLYYGSDSFFKEAGYCGDYENPSM
ncbi:uncharacterized protein LOC122066411 [Macadamia integrifolia]|uniref:uncharacterized protein LOC122066411 n=1 Tax=Macadamia integrifolia TaxID=60698 RepID=UPI001C4F6E91|nr:uncharacterized protein LOC122066411 [Macadamia integrifolia]